MAKENLIYTTDAGSNFDSLSTYEWMLSQHKQYPKLSKEELSKLLKAAKGGDMKSREIIIGSNLGLLSLEGKKFKVKGVEIADLYQQGCIGLDKAIDTFNEERGSFSTHAVTCIDSEIKAYLEKNRYQIKIPREKYRDSGKINRLKDEYTAEHHKVPTSQELSSYINLARFTPEYIDEVMEDISNVQALSLDAQYGDDDDAYTLGDTLGENDEYDVDDKTLQVQSMLETLDFEHARVITAKFNLDRQEFSDEEIAEELGVSIEKVNQIYNEALKQLQSRFGPNKM